MKSTIFLDRQKAVFEGQGMDAVLIEKPIDLFYLTGLNLSLGTLILSKNRALLLVDGRYLGLAQEKGPCACELMSASNLEKALRPFSKVGFDSSAVSYQRWEQLKKASKGLTPLRNPTEKARAVKSAAELKLLKKSAALLWKGFEHIRKKLKTGITEKEVAMQFEVFCLQQGAEKMAFDPIVAFGKNSAFPHYRPGEVCLKKGDTVLLDLGVVIDHYHSDMTRTLFYGTPDPRLLVFEKVVKAAHQAALKLCRPGAKVGELDRAARRVIEKAGLTEHIAHSLGHGVGLEIHEFPRLKHQGENSDVVLQEGMVITIEPGLYWPGVGGYRFEDTIVITRKGYENWYS